MKKVVLNIENSKYNFFIELMRSLDFVHIEEDSGDSQEEIVANLTQAFKDLKLYKEGKLKTTSAKELLNEL